MKAIKRGFHMIAAIAENHVQRIAAILQSLPKITWFSGIAAIIWEPGLSNHCDPQLRLYGKCTPKPCNHRTKVLEKKRSNFSRNHLATICQTLVAARFENDAKYIGSIVMHI